MGLGKTLQAIAVAMLKKDIYGLHKTLIICPASLKYQWKKEIERFTGEKAVIIEGMRSTKLMVCTSARLTQNPLLAPVERPFVGLSQVGVINFKFTLVFFLFSPQMQ